MRAAASIPAAWLVAVAVALASSVSARPAGGQPCALVENFSAPLPSSPTVRCRVDLAGAKVGLAAGRVEYRFQDPRSQAYVWFPAEARPLPGPGTLKLWIKGDNSGNVLQLTIRHAKASNDTQGRRRYDNTRDERLKPVTLDFDQWREISFDLRALPAGRTAWWHGMVFQPSRKDKTPKLSGSVLLDDMRLVPLKPKAGAVVAAGLLGEKARLRYGKVQVFLDVRNFTGRAATFRTHLAVTDRSDNAVASRDFTVKLAAGQARETALDLAVENLGLFLPPLRIAGDVLSADLPEVSVRIDETLVLANSRFLFETFSDVDGGWATRGYRGPWDRLRSFTVAEAYRFSTLAQTSIRLSRVDLARTVAAGGPGPKPPGPYAMRVDFNGDGAVFNARPEGNRSLPGNAFRAGFWVKGDRSGAKLTVIVHDHSDMADFWAGGWKRVEDEQTLCVLNFDGWRYVEIPLPGGGIGTNTPRGSTRGIDFPLELAAFRIDARPERRGQPARRGTVFLGPILAWTQQRLAETLSVAVGYDDPNRLYAPSAGANVTVHNAWPGGPRAVRADWAVLDRDRKVRAKGSRTLSLPPAGSRSFRVDLAPHAKALADATGPLTLAVSAASTKDVSIAATTELVLAKPDSLVRFAPFEEDRGYLGSRGYAIARPTDPSAPRARTTTAKAHGGTRSLAIRWDAETDPNHFVAIDPPLPGAPVSLTLWVHGDGSGVMLYPLIGDRRGVNKGATHGQWDYFLPRATTGGLQDAVRVDWTGWKKLRFRLPLIPPSWRDEQPIRSFVPSYPLGLHLVVRARGAAARSGVIYVDDIEVDTHLPKAGRVDLVPVDAGGSNVLAPGSEATVWLSNHDRFAARTVRLRGGVFDWRGRRMGGGPAGEMRLAPASRKRLAIAKALPAGMYSIRVELLEGGARRAAIDRDLLVADLAPLLGKDGAAALSDAWTIRGPVDERTAFVDEDWDWVERYPGNVQTDTAVARARAIRSKGGRPMMLLGYSAFWAAGSGFEQRKANALSIRLRDEGHAVDIFMIPERIEDWDHYACEMMRNVGSSVAGWVCWDNPDGSGPLGMKAKRFAPLLESADRWRRVYCPTKPLLIGGMSRETAPPYVEQLAAAGALKHFTGVNVRLDVGRLSPEDAQVIRYTRRLQAALKGTKEAPKSIFYTDLDWAVERDPNGLGGFDQAAYLARSALLMAGVGLQPALSIANEDTERLGLGLTYRQARSCPPLLAKPDTYLFKPAWWAMVNTRRLLRKARFLAEIEIADVVPGRTRCCLLARPDGTQVAAVWRNDNPGWVRLAPTGLAVTGAEDLLGSRPPADNGWYAVGKIPTLFELKSGAEPAGAALRRLAVRDGKDSAWPQRVLEAFTPAAGSRVKYRQTAGSPSRFDGRTPDGRTRRLPGLRFAPGGTERFELALPAGSGLVLRKGFFLGPTGQLAEVAVNGKPVGTWDLRRSEKELSGGLREAVFFVPARAIAGPVAAVELTYGKTGGNTTGWTVLRYVGGTFPLTAMGPIHADQNVGSPRAGRNVIGSKLRIGEKAFENGIGCFAQSLLEYPLDGRFARFTATVGVDAAAEGRGSVVFEVHGDGKKLWASPLLSGLDAPKKIDLPVSGVKRLRLIVTDGGDGNRYDAADWCDPTLHPAP